MCLKQGLRTKRVSRTTTRWPAPNTGADWSQRLRVNGPELRLAWAEFLGRIPWDMFTTLTFDSKRVFPVGRELADREVFWWLSVAGHIFRRPIGWVYVVERHASGLWHGHALVSGAGAAASWKVASDIWRVRNGLADIQRVDSIEGAALYTSKSVAVDGEVVLSDTLSRYQRLAPAPMVVRLTPDEG
jgi:hypothetical protein